jgi:hypothetical protein
MITSSAMSLFAIKNGLNQAAPYLTIALVYLASSLPGMGALYLAFSLVGLIYWTYKKKDQLVLLLFLLGSSFSYTSLSIWNNGVVPGLPFLLLVILLLIGRVRIAIGPLLITLLCAVVFFVHSLGNIYEVGISPVIVDLLVVSSIPLAALRFRRLSEYNFILAFSVCALITLLKMAVFAYLGVENPVLSTYNDAKFLDTLDELIGFYFLFVLMLVATPNQLRWVAVCLFGVLTFHYVSSDVWLGYYGVGSQVLLMLIFFIVFILVRFPICFGAIVGATLILAPIMATFWDDHGDLKLQQLRSVFEILGHGDIALLPHSVHVRLAEMKTFSDLAWTHKFFGGGLGGYINLSSDFPGILGPDDYSENQLISGKIVTPHNLGYLIIKFGYVGVVLAFLFLARIYLVARKMTSIKFALYMTLGLFLILNLGYTLKISLLLGVLWSLLTNYRRLEEDGVSEHFNRNSS